MPKTILITNKLNINKLKKDDQQIIFFNPIGFSKKKIIKELNDVLKNYDVKDCIELDFENYFFGNRIRYISAYIEQKFNIKK